MINLIPHICADELPDDILEYCIEKDWPVHYASEVVEVDLENDNLMLTWLESQGYTFPEKSIERGWGHIGLTGS